MIFEEDFFLPPRREGDEIYLVFHPARSRVSAWQSDELLTGLVWIRDARLPPNILHLRVDDDASSGEVRIRALEGPPELARIVVRHQEELLLYGPPADGEFSCPETESVQLASLAEILPGPADYLNELWTLLDKAPTTPLWNYRRFFADLDRHTDDVLRKEYLGAKDPALLALMDAVIPTVMATLSDCLTRRAVDPTHGYRCPEYPGAAAVHGELRAVSDLFLSLVFKYFRAPGRGLDLESFEDAFEMFANGELRLELPSGAWTTQPSSGYYFYFAEFALTCAMAGIETGLWTRLANCQVRTQRIFCKVYEPSAPPPWDLAHYKADDYDAARTFTRVEKAELARLFLGKSLEELCIAQAAHLEEFAPDTVPPVLPSLPPVGLPMPAPPPPAPARTPDAHPVG